MRCAKPFIRQKKVLPSANVTRKPIPHDELIHAIVFSDGSGVNGSELVAGIAAHLPPHVPLTGGLAGDADRFEETYVIWDGVAAQHTIALLGLYGKQLRVGYGSLGGWDTFGAERRITRASRQYFVRIGRTIRARVIQKRTSARTTGFARDRVSLSAQHSHT